MTNKQIPENPSKIKPTFNDTAIEVLNKRYLLKDEEGNVIESPADMLWRVAYNISEAEKNYINTNGEYDPDKYDNLEITIDEERIVITKAVEFYEIMAKGEFLPNSPTLMNAGTADPMLSACFVLPIEDSMDSIFTTIKNTAMIHKQGGGTGFSFSNLRPSNDIVKSTSGVSSGPISFMGVFDKATDVVSQAGKRRGANMGILRIDHPDILEFMKVKSDLNKLNNFNLSIAITDKFMKAVKARTNYDIINPRNGKVVDKYDAYEVFNQITEQAWTSGEPGLIFIEEINRMNPTRHYCEIEATNPCQPKWAPLKTPTGIISMGDVKIGDSIWCKNKWTKITNKQMTGIKDVYAYETNAGIFFSTDNHRIKSNGRKIIVSEAKSIDTLQCMIENDCVDNLDKQAIIDGLMIGDGTFHKASNTSLLCIGEKDQDYFSSDIKEYIGKSYCAAYKYKINSTISENELCLTPEREIPEKYIFTSNEKIAGFLSGLFSANGSVVVSGKRIQLKASSYKLIRQVQMMLSGLGIISYITTTKANEIEWHNGKYTSKESYTINIGPGRNSFKRHIKFLQKYKQNALNKITETNGKARYKTYDILKNYKISEEEVYSITVEDDSHTYWSFGFDTSNCGELPLESYNSCNLGSINLSKCYNHTTNDIDYSKLHNLVYLGVNFLDNVIDVNQYPLKKIDETTKLYRKIGLGVMGFADLLLIMKIPYSSQKALEFAEHLMKYINDTAYAASIKLGEERGVYPVYDEQIKDNSNIHLDEPCRNAARTTVAPTGTISILAGCSSGIEPIFSLAFVRNIMDNDEFFEVNPVFNEISKINDFHSDHIIRQLAKEGTVKHVDGIPDEHKLYLESAHDISPESHVQMQATFQRHIDSSISKTINFPSDATEEDVRNAYLMAYELKCKGITIYRDGCRQNQVLNIGENAESEKSEELKELKESNIERRIKKDRPSVLNGSTYEMGTGCGKLFVTINEDSDGSVFENFNTIGKAGGCASSQCEAIGRLISLALRSGQQSEEIIKSLVGISCHKPFGFGDNKVLSCADAIAKAFIKHVSLKDNNEEQKNITEYVHMYDSSSGACPECGGVFEHEGGCGVCHSCGFSQCG